MDKYQGLFAHARSEESGGPEQNCAVALSVRSLLRLRVLDFFALSQAEKCRLLDAFGDVRARLQSMPPFPQSGLFPDEQTECLLQSTSDYLLTVGLSGSEFVRWLRLFRLDAVQFLGRPIAWADLSLSRIPIVGLLPPLWARIPVDCLLDPQERLHLPSGLLTLGDLSECSEHSLADSGVELPAVAAAARPLWLLRAKLDSMGAWEPAQPDELMNSVPSYSAFIRSVMHAGLRDREPLASHMEVLLGRSGFESGHPLTLAEVGLKVGVTRARIGQIEDKALKHLRADLVLRLLTPLRLLVRSTLIEVGGSRSAARLAASVVEQMGWSDSDVPGVARLISVMPDVFMAKEGVATLPTLGCTSCVVLLQDLVNELSNGQPVPLKDATDRIVELCSRARPQCQWLRGMDRERVVGLVPNLPIPGGPPGIQSDWMIPVNYRGRPDSKTAQVISVLRETGHVMHAREVCDVLNERDGASWTERNVYATLERHPDAVSWDTGSFVHVEDMPFPYALVREIEDWFVERLEGSDPLPMMSAAAAFSAFSDRLIGAGVEAELALYSLLRISADPRLVYPRYAKVYSAAFFEGRVPLHMVLQDYVLDAGEPVSISDLRDYICARMGFKEFQLQIALSEAPDLLTYDRGRVIHADLVTVEPSAQRRILDKAAELVAEEGTFAATKLFEMAEVDCVLNHIGSPRFLHSLIGLWSEPGVVAGRYPSIHGGQANTADGVTEMVLEHVRAKLGPCSMRELEDVFVEARGFRPPTVWAVTRSEGVYRYVRGVIIHSDAIGWDPGKQERLELVAGSLLDRRREGGKDYARVSDLVEATDLPYLANGMVWTEPLLADLLARSGSFLVLGSARNAYLRADNPDRTRSFGDLVAAIVDHEFAGGAGLDALGQRLRSDKLIIKNLTPGMLSDSSRISVSGLEVTLSGVGTDA